MRNSRWLFVPVLLAVCAYPAPAGADFVYAVIDPSGNDGTDLGITGLNASGQATGYYFDVDGNYHGFVRDAGGSITTFAGPGGGTTFANAMNNSGEVAGIYYDAGNHLHGFLRDPGGLLTPFDVPGSRRTVIGALNDSGASAGTYTDANNIFHGFIRQANGMVNTLDVPGATGTIVSSLNASGVVAGAYSDANGMFHGYLRAAGGSYTLFDPPGGLNTPVLLNDAGLVAGAYHVGGENQPPYHGYLRGTSGTIVPFDVPGSTNTYVYALNNAGAIGGQYDALGLAFGFVRGPDGLIATLTAPGDIGGGTYVTALNDSGQAAGSYYDSNNRIVGFIATPTAVPEPGPLVLMAIGGLAGLVYHRRRSRTAAPLASPGRALASRRA
jgi:hypothetical protein